MIDFVVTNCYKLSRKFVTSCGKVIVWERRLVSNFPFDLLRVFHSTTSMKVKVKVYHELHIEDPPLYFSSNERESEISFLLAPFPPPAPHSWFTLICQATSLSSNRESHHQPDIEVVTLSLILLWSLPPTGWFF